MLAYDRGIRINNVDYEWNAGTVAIRFGIYCDSDSTLRAVSIDIRFVASIPTAVNNSYAVAIVAVAGITAYLNIFEDIAVRVLNALCNMQRLNLSLSRLPIAAKLSDH